MLKRIQTLVDVVPVTDRRNSDWVAVVNGEPVVLSYLLGDAVARVLGRLASNGQDGVKNGLVVGGPGSGKTRFLSIVKAVLTPGDAPIHPRMLELRAALGGHEMVVVEVPTARGNNRLSAAIALEVLDRFAELGLPPLTHLDADDPARHLEVLALAAGSLPDGVTLVLVVDELDRWLRAEAPLGAANIATVLDLGALARSSRFAVCAAVREDALTDDALATPDRSWVGAISDAFHVERLATHSLRAAMASRLLRKGARQRHDIAAVRRELCERLPDLPASADEFEECYPIETTTWTIATRLHQWIDGFSFAAFVAQAASAVERRPTPSLFALNDLFTLVEPQLRRVEQLAPTFAAYDALVARAVPALAAPERLRARLGLQALVMLEVAGFPATIKAVADGALLYELGPGGSGYDGMMYVFARLEEVCEGRIESSGVGRASRFRLVAEPPPRAGETVGARGERLAAASAYLAEAETIADPYLVDLRADLMRWLGRPEALADPRRLDIFLDAFGTFRDVYTSHYAREHQVAVSPQVIDRLCSALVGSYVWSVLEALSSLSIGNPAFLVSAIDQLSRLRERQCDADPRVALAGRPVCRCGFRFADASRLHATVSEVNNTIQAGIDHHRGELQRRRTLLQARLKATKSAYDVETIKTIAALAKDAPLPYVDMKAIRALNELLHDEVERPKRRARSASG